MNTAIRHLVGASLVALAALSGVAQAATGRPPNIIFILADDLGYADVGCYGQKEIKTPSIDRLAKEGVRFTQFYAGATVCAPSRNVLMTGRHNGRVRIRGNAKVDLLPAPEDVTVAEVLKGAGYATGLFGKWGLGKDGSMGAPVRKGFDEFFGYADQTHAHNYYPTFLVRGDTRVPLRNVVPDEGPYGQGVATVRVDYSAELIADEALGFIDRHAGEPFFLYFATTLPHANNEAREKGMEVPDHGEFAGRDWPEPEKGFAAMVTRLDRDVGRVLERLEANGIADNTVVIFTSDNGPHAEGGNDPAFFDSNGPLRGLKRDLYEGGIREPMIVRWPGHASAGSVSEHVGYFGDFMATAAELASVAAPADLDSISFVPVISGQADQQRSHEWLYWEFYEGGSSQAVRFGDWKAIRQPMFTGEIELYDLAADVGETRDVAAEHPELVEKARAIMEQAHVPSSLWTVHPRP